MIAIKYFAKHIAVIALMLAIVFSTMSIAQEIDTGRAQNILNAIGYEAGSEDGQFGPKTESALKLFQKEHGIPVTGVIDKDTEYLLNYRARNLVTEPIDSEPTLIRAQNNANEIQHEAEVEAEVEVEVSEFNALDWIILATLLLAIFLFFWLTYRMLRWTINSITKLFSKVLGRKEFDNPNKYDIKAEQIPTADYPTLRSKNNKPQRKPFREGARNPVSVQIKHATPNPYNASTNDSNQLTTNVEDIRSAQQNGFTTVKEKLTKKDKSSWVSSGKKIKVKGFLIDGLVYVGPAPHDGRMNGPENSFIDPSLSVGKLNTDWEGKDLSYWPNYSHLSTTARATYLNWLSEGRTRIVNPGYMFLFFYGLERRYFRDTPTAQDRENIIIEVVRLRNLFSANRSASKYLNLFLDAVSLGEYFDSPPEVRVAGGLPLSLKVGIGHRILRRENITSDWLLAWYLATPETKLLTPARRCSVEFKAMFKALFEKDYPNGIPVKVPKRKLKPTYDAASGQFSADLSRYTGDIPDIATTRKPLNYAEKIAETATNSLSGLSRLLAKNADARDTLYGHTLLPVEIQSLFPCDEISVAKNWALNIIANGGLIDPLDLMEQLNKERPDKYTRKRLTDASDTLVILGIGMAPDPRFALRSPKNNEPVILFELPEGTKEINVSDSFRVASLKLGAATLMAKSDNEFSDEELNVINSIVANANGLNEAEKVRLAATARWMQAVPPDMSTLKKKIKLTPKDTRELIANLAIEVAVADGDATNEEIKQLETLYKALELDQSNIHSALHNSFSSNLDEPVTMRPANPAGKGPSVPTEPHTRKSGIGLDLAKIEKIDKNTQSVSALLNDIFSEKAVEETEDVITVPADTGSISGLSPKLTGLARALAKQEFWSETEFAALVTQHGAMPAGAVEAINEWSFNTFDRAFLDEYNGYDVDPDIAAEIGG